MAGEKCKYETPHFLPGIFYLSFSAFGQVYVPTGFLVLLGSNAGMSH